MDPTPDELTQLGTLPAVLDWAEVSQGVALNVFEELGHPAFIRDVVFIPRETWDASVLRVRVRDAPGEIQEAPKRTLNPVDLSRLEVFRRVCFRKAGVYPDTPGRASVTDQRQARDIPHPVMGNMGLPASGHQVDQGKGPEVKPAIASGPARSEGQEQKSIPWPSATGKLGPPNSQHEEGRGEASLAEIIPSEAVADKPSASGIRLAGPLSQRRKRHPILQTPIRAETPRERKKPHVKKEDDQSTHDGGYFSHQQERPPDRPCLEYGVDCPTSHKACAMQDSRTNVTYVSVRTGPGVREGLTTTETKRLEDGNAHTAFVARVMQVCHSAVVPFVLEGPEPLHPVSIVNGGEIKEVAFIQVVREPSQGGFRGLGRELVNRAIIGGVDHEAALREVRKSVGALLKAEPYMSSANAQSREKVIQCRTGTSISAGAAQPLEALAGQLVAKPHTVGKTYWLGSRTHGEQSRRPKGLPYRRSGMDQAIQEVIRESVAAGPVDLLDFALQVIPRVEQKLFEAKSPKLLTLFQKLDAVGTGSLSSTDCIEALRRHADSFSTVLDGDLMDQLHGSMEHKFGTDELHRFRMI
eukprot:s1327_g14.t1